MTPPTDDTAPKPRRRPPRLNAELSAREIEILCHVVNRDGAPQAAAHLNLSLDTVRTHLHAIYMKLGVPNLPRALTILLATKRLRLFHDGSITPTRTDTQTPIGTRMATRIYDDVELTVSKRVPCRVCGRLVTRTTVLTRAIDPTTPNAAGNPKTPEDFSADQDRILAELRDEAAAWQPTDNIHGPCRATDNGTRNNRRTPRTAT